MNLAIIKQFCAEKRIPLKGLAEKVGITDAGLYKAMQRNDIAATTLEKIAEVLDVAVSEFFKAKRTKLQAFNQMQFDVSVPDFLKEVCENATESGKANIPAVAYNIFLNLLGQVAERAIELNDPVLNAFMLRLGLYDVEPQKRRLYVAEMEKEYKK